MDAQIMGAVRDWEMLCGTFLMNEKPNGTQLKVQTAQSNWWIELSLSSTYLLFKYTGFYLTPQIET